MPSLVQSWLTPVADSAISHSDDDFAEPLVPGAIVVHGGDDWRVDEVDESNESTDGATLSPARRLPRQRALGLGGIGEICRD